MFCVCDIRTSFTKHTHLHSIIRLNSGILFAIERADGGVRNGRKKTEKENKEGIVCYSIEHNLNKIKEN